MAVVRTCEAIGVQEVSIIASYMPPLGLWGLHRAAERSASASGSGPWINLRLHASLSDCMEHLRSGGYAVIASDLASSVELERLFPVGRIGAEAAPVSDAAIGTDQRREGRIALTFGNEERGISRLMRSTADACFRLPIAGLTQSYNLSGA